MATGFLLLPENPPKPPKPRLDGWASPGGTDATCVLSRRLREVGAGALAASADGDATAAGATTAGGAVSATALATGAGAEAASTEGSAAGADGGAAASTDD